MSYFQVEQPFSIAMSPSGRRSPIVTRSSSRVVADPGSTSAGSSRAYPIDSRQATHSSDDGFRIRYEVVESLPFVSTPPEDIRNILGFSSLLKKRRRSTTEEWVSDESFFLYLLIVFLSWQIFASISWLSCLLGVLSWGLRIDMECFDTIENPNLFCL